MYFAVQLLPIDAKVGCTRLFRHVLDDHGTCVEFSVLDCLKTKRRTSLCCRSGCGSEDRLDWLADVGRDSDSCHTC